MSCEGDEPSDRGAMYTASTDRVLRVAEFRRLSAHSLRQLPFFHASLKHKISIARVLRLVTSRGTQAVSELFHAHIIPSVLFSLTKLVPSVPVNYTTA